MRTLHRSILCLSLILASATLTGCSQKFNDVNDTVKIALFGEADIKLDQDDIYNLPYASIYAKVSNGPQAFMVLALAESQTSLGQHQATSQQAKQLKWMSSDNGMLVTESGRLVKTLNLPQGNLIETISSQPDPLALGLHLPSTPTTWQRKIDWQPGYHYGYTLQSEFTRQKNTVIIVNEKPIEALHFTEIVTVSSLSIEYQNDFWLYPQTGKVLKSKQKLAPSLPYVEITLLKPYS
ncbi:lipoprotein YmcC precursor [Photobacterium proteolyticum]|uniref:Lipoprotein YmcC n=1 Tax=Photobacterium proteolyticum TaxID=1903952 RepID=A0A1Q9GN62_9GAMM|nr:YjbF family lipoprotein [Photobacterium proteolyticum]OLQ76102.1 lipoprotein YmcC precursor [Photobacterium proteolyticum]